MKYLLLLFAFVTLSYTQFNSEQALTALYFSKISYCAPNDITNWNCVPCQHYRVNSASQTKVFTDSYNGGQVFVTYSKSVNSIVIAFRGS